MASVGLSGACLGVQLQFTEGRLQMGDGEIDVRYACPCGVYESSTLFSGHRIGVGWALGDYK